MQTTGSRKTIQQTESQNASGQLLTSLLYEYDVIRSTYYEIVEHDVRYDAQKVKDEPGDCFDETCNAHKGHPPPSTHRPSERQGKSQQRSHLQNTTAERIHLRKIHQVNRKFNSTISTFLNIQNNIFAFVQLPVALKTVNIFSILEEEEEELLLTCNERRLALLMPVAHCLTATEHCVRGIK